MLNPETMTQRQKTLALLTLIVALVLEIVDMTIVNTALPAIKTAFRADAQASQWIVAGYSLAFALLLMTGGRLGDSFGYRRMFLWGVAGFTLSSLACGLAGTATQLVAARLAQGATGAIMSPQFMALLQVMFQPLERVSKLALFGLIGGLASIIGPIIGGLLIEANLFGLGWRVIFLINLPVGTLAIWAGARFLPETRSTRPPGFDWAGMAFFGLALGALLWPLIRIAAARLGWFEWLCFAVAMPLVWLGWRHVSSRVKQHRAALFDPMLFGIGAFRRSLEISIAFSAANAGFLLTFAFALQNERGMTPLATGLLHVPFGFGAMFGIAFLGRRYLPRFGKWILVFGCPFMALFATLSLLGIGIWDLSWPALAPFMFASGIGMGMVSGCVPPIAVAQVDKAHAGAASGLLKTSQQLGATFGVALVGTTYFAGPALAGVAGSAMALLALVPLLLLAGLFALALPSQIFAQMKPA
jgi:MFS family permease